MSGKTVETEHRSTRLLLPARPGPDPTPGQQQTADLGQIGSLVDYLKEKLEQHRTKLSPKGIAHLEKQIRFLEQEKIEVGRPIDQSESDDY